MYVKDKGGGGEPSDRRMSGGKRRTGIVKSTRLRSTGRDRGGEKDTKAGGGGIKTL